MGGRRASLESPSEHQVEHKRVSIARAKKQFWRLLVGNFNNRYSFITLTFRDDCGFNIRDLDTCTYELQKFLKRLKNSHQSKSSTVPSLKYLAVTEFQDETDRGAIHFHLITNVRIRHSQLKDLWGHGHVWTENCHTSATGDQRVSRYLTKGIYDQRLDGRHRFFRSQGLMHPQELSEEEAQEFLEHNDLEKHEPIDAYRYGSSTYGEVQYEAYILPAYT